MKYHKNFTKREQRETLFHYWSVFSPVHCKLCLTIPVRRVVVSCPVLQLEQRVAVPRVPEVTWLWRHDTWQTRAPRHGHVEEGPAETTAEKTVEEEVGGRIQDLGDLADEGEDDEELVVTLKLVAQRVLDGEEGVGEEEDEGDSNDG